MKKISEDLLDDFLYDYIYKRQKISTKMLLEIYGLEDVLPSEIPDLIPILPTKYICSNCECEQLTKRILSRSTYRLSCSRCRIDQIVDLNKKDQKNIVLNQTKNTSKANNIPEQFDGKIEPTIDWPQTTYNIKNYLYLNGISIEDLIYLFPGYSDSYIRYMFDSNDYTIDFIHKLSCIFHVTINDLIVLSNDTLISYSDSELTNVESMPFEKRIDSINELISNAENSKVQYKKEIASLEEFLLYLPLLNIKSLFDYLIRIDADFANDSYPTNLIASLYDSIPESKAKEFCDSYRDNILRVKGNRKFVSNNNYTNLAPGKEEYRSQLQTYYRFTKELENIIQLYSSTIQ